MVKRSNSILWFVIEYSLAAVSVFLILLNDSGDHNRLAAAVLLLINLISLIKVRKNWYLLIVFGIIAYCNYSICIANYFYMFRSFFTGFANTDIGAKGLNILLSFSLVLLLFVPRPTGTTEYGMAIIENNRKNKIIVYGISVVLLLIWFFGFRRPDVIGQRGSPTALYEYSLVFFIVSLYYSGKDKLLISLNLILAAGFALQNFIFGGRITGVQIVIMMVLCLTIDRLKLRKILPFFAVFFLLMTGIGQLRGNIAIVGISFKSVFRSALSGRFSMDTAYSAYYTSLTFLRQLQQETIGHRLYLFLRWCLSMFLGGSVADSNLAVYTRQFFMHYFGGVLPFFAWFYLGPVGIALLSLYLRFIFKLMIHTDSQSGGLQRCVIIYLCSTTFRWYLYSPSQLFRGVMLLCVVYGIAYAVDGKYRRFETNKNPYQRRPQI